MENLDVQREQYRRSANREILSYADARQRLHHLNISSDEFYLALQLSERLLRVFVQYQAICQLCNEQVDVADISLDHIIARRFNGSDAITNLQLTHQRCNFNCCLHAECFHVEFQKKLKYKLPMNQTGLPFYWFKMVA